jgi:hypothetical protein
MHISTGYSISLTKDCIFDHLLHSKLGENFFFFNIFGFFFFSFSVQYSALLHLPPLRSTVPTDTGIEPRTVATGALTVRRSNH